MKNEEESRFNLSNYKFKTSHKYPNGDEVIEIEKVKYRRDSSGRFAKGNIPITTGKERPLNVRKKISNKLNKDKTDKRILPFYRNNIRNKFIKLKNSQCERCGVSGEATRKGNLEVHHKIPLKDGGTNNIKNLMLLCRKCHKYQHKLREVKK